MFKPLNPQPKFPELEEEILSYWDKNKTFEKSLESLPTQPKTGKWTFLDGPPFITGLPHYGTLLVSIPKDMFPRYWTMKGYIVRRVWGWDVHGLPAENKVENKLGIKRKKDIEDIVGIKKFIEECKLYVRESSAEWKWYIDHIARWADFENAYKTMDLTYMESVMWVFKQMYDKKLIYKGRRVSLYCPHCSTPISNFEVAMDADNYKSITEPANTYKYQLKEEKNTYLLAWSTTPWNKIATNALAVNPKLDYLKVKQNDEYYILAKGTLKILEGKYEISEEFKGSELIGKEFVPHYVFFKIDLGKKNFVVIPGDFVTEDEGTGVVTIAAYGEDDMAAMKKENVQLVLHVDEEGKLIEDVTPWAGMYYLKVNPLVNKDLEERGLMYKEEEISHTVPTCWRCHTRLFYAPQNAWYVDIQTLKPKLKQTNEAVNWYPSHFKYGRFLKSLEAAPDWCISRSRYWGSPVPVWECKCGERFVPGSIKELEDASGQKISDLHKPEIDEVVVTCTKCGEKAHRVPEVLDSWIEAGSAPYAERHYPFNENIKLEDFFPPDFIIEYTGQIRAWFYVLHVISTAIFEANAFKNVAVTGVILGTDGKKMSKNLGNYPDPKKMLQLYGGDALRLYLLSSPVMKGEDMSISEEDYKNQIRAFLLPLWNIYNFFITYANLDNITEFQKPDLKKMHILDKWILSRVNNLNKNVSDFIESYDTISTVEQLTLFIDDASKWYVRRSRDRVGLSVENKEDKMSFYNTFYLVLEKLLRNMAPVAPFISDYLYQHLTKNESVHLMSWPETETEFIDDKLEQEMILARKIVEAGHQFRKANNLKVRMPLRTIKLKIEEEVSSVRNEVWDIVLSELNIKNIQVNETNYPEQEITISDEELQQEGRLRDIIREVQGERKKLNLKPDDIIILELPDYPDRFKEQLMKKVMANEIKSGDKLKITTVVNNK